MSPTDIERKLALTGIRYDIGDERFYDGARRVEPEEIFDLIPGLIEDELIDYIERRHEQG
jgi:hypothetical protein